MKVQEACDKLNTLLEVDREAVATLLSYRVPCNKELADHKFVQARKESEDSYSISTIGLLQAFIKGGIISYEADPDNIPGTMENFRPYKGK